MLKTGIFHPQLSKIMAEIRHMDMLVIADAGLPVPKGVERVDLGWKQGSPSYLEVLEAIEKYMVTERAVFAQEALEVSRELHNKALALLPEGIPVEYIPHSELKKMTEGAKAIILTGEFTGYTNVILISGCAY